MMAYTVEDVIARHREVKADLAVMSARHEQEIKPLNETIRVIEAWLLQKMNEDGVDSYKTQHGTAYQSHLKSVKLEDPIAFRDYVLRPAAEQIVHMVEARGGQPSQHGDDVATILKLVNVASLWDLADMKPGKKGIIKHQEDTNQQVPGVSFTEIVNVNVKGS